MLDILQPTHLLFVLLVALIILGPKRLGQTSQSLGHTMRSIQEHREEFKEGLLGTTHDEDEPDKKHPEEKKRPDKEKAAKENEGRKEG